MQGDNETVEFVFPARAGMSPGGFMFFATLESVPRASGDEPHV